LGAKLINVLHLIETTEPGGAETMLLKIATGLDKEFFSLGGVLGPGWISAELERRNIPVFYLPLRRSFDLGWVKRLQRIIRERQVRLVHSHEFTTNCYATLAAKNEGIPIICTVHGKNYYPERYYRRTAYRWVAKNASAFVAVSDDLKRFLHRRLRISNKRIRTVANGIEAEQFDDPCLDREKIRRQLGIRNDTVVIITVAALSAVKGHADLLVAAKEVMRCQKNVMFLIVGEGPLETDLRRLSEELGVSPAVRFLGFRDDVPALLRASDIFTLTSYSEGQPVSVLEAMASGLPLIATAVGGTPELVAEGVNGHLVQPRCPRVLADTICRLARDSASRRSLGEAGCALVRKEFSVKRMIAEYAAIYREFLPTKVPSNRDARPRLRLEEDQARAGAGCTSPSELTSDRQQ
jgi:glycosyltransferase involved in cell wall biosynthesis